MKKVTCFLMDTKVDLLMERILSKGLTQVRLFQFDKYEVLDTVHGGGKMKFDTKLELYVDKDDLGPVVDEILMFKYYTSDTYIEIMELEKTLIVERKKDDRLMELLEERKKLCTK